MHPTFRTECKISGHYFLGDIPTDNKPIQLNEAILCILWLKLSYFSLWENKTLDPITKEKEVQ
jgi:hypothetical protein